jgi:transmembrane sensor
VSSARRPPSSPEALEQAAEWFALLLSGEATAAERRRWEGWLAASEEHRLAWSHVENLGRRFDSIRMSRVPRVVASAYREISAAQGGRRRLLLGIVTLAGSSLLGWASWRHTPLPGIALAWSADYRTGTGEVREFALADGSRVWLNAVSAFNQHYGTRQRRLHLINGEMLIDTATDPMQRPFYVDTPHGRLQALGTRFAVRLEDAAQTKLAVFDGAVEIRTGDGVTAIVEAGQQARFTVAEVSGIGPADPAREAWTRGVLIARDMPLTEVVAELRRHHHGHLGLAPEIENLRVFGSYPANDPEQALAMLESVMPVRVRKTLPWWVSVEARPL